MRLKLEIRGDTIGDIMDGLKAAERRFKLDIVMTTGDNTGKQEKIKPFETVDGNLEHPFKFSVSNHHK